MKLMKRTEKRREERSSAPATSTPSSLALGLAGLLASVPAGILALIGLAIAGVPFVQTLLITVGAQILIIVFVGAFGYWRLSTNERASGFAEACGHGSPVHRSRQKPDTWRVHSHDDGVDDVFRVGLIAPNTAQGRSIAATLAELGGEVHHSTDPLALLESVKAQPECWSLVLFDLEAAPDLGTAVDDLIDFRNEVPGMPVMIMTHGVARSDFSGHRRAIADATLRKPVFRKQLLNAMDIIGLKISPPIATSGSPDTAS